MGTNPKRTKGIDCRGLRESLTPNSSLVLQSSYIFFKEAVLSRREKSALVQAIALVDKEEKVGK